MLILLFIYFTITLKYNSPFWTSIKWRKISKHFLTYIPLGVLLALTVVGLSAVLPSLEKAADRGVARTSDLRFLFAALGVLVAPFVEELIFRGFIYPVVERAIGSGLPW